MWTLTVATFHILDKPHIQKLLRAELTEAMPDPNTILAWDELEKLPYLSAVIAEGKSDVGKRRGKRAPSGSLPPCMTCIKD